MLAPCVLNRLIRDCGKSWTYFIGWCHKNCCLFQLQLFLLFIIFFFSRKVQLSLCAKEFRIQHQRHSSCPRTEKCIQLFSSGVSNSRNPFFTTRKYFSTDCLWLYSLNFYCMCDYVLSWSIYHKILCFSRDVNTLPRFFFFSAICTDELHFENRENLLRDTERFDDFFLREKRLFYSPKSW